VNTVSAIFQCLKHHLWDWSVGIATCYGVEGPRIEFRWGEMFRTRPERPWGPPSLLYVQWVPGPSPGVKRPGRGVNHPPHLAPRLNKEYSYTSTPSLGLRGLFTFTLPQERYTVCPENVLFKSTRVYCKHRIFNLAASGRQFNYEDISITNYAKKFRKNSDACSRLYPADI
jgi:hypothetical protein